MIVSGALDAGAPVVLAGWVDGALVGAEGLAEADTVSEVALELAVATLALVVGPTRNVGALVLDPRCRLRAVARLCLRPRTVLALPLSAV